MDFNSSKFGMDTTYGWSAFDKIYKRIVEGIVLGGHDQKGEEVRAKYADGTPATTRFIEAVNFTIYPGEVPLLQSKFVAVKSALKEMEWIWQEMSNDVEWLKERNVKIWNEWQREDGTIGKAYGYQLATKSPGKNLNQVEYVIDQLKTNPGSRRIMTSLWGVDDLDDMALQPCVWATNWKVVDGKLSLHVKQRSADVALGLPFNVYQYSMLHRLMAESTGYGLGCMYWTIDDAHIYHRHIPAITQQVNAVELPKSRPSFEFPGSSEDTFFDRKLSEVIVSNYEHNGSIKFEVAE